MPKDLTNTDEKVELQLQGLRAELADARRQLAEAQEVIRAIQSGDVDAAVVLGPRGSQVYTLQNADSSYRAIVEAMNEGAASLDPDGNILYCNQALSELVGVPLEKIVGHSVSRLAAERFKPALDKLMQRALTEEWATAEMELIEANGSRTIPVHLSLSRVLTDGIAGLCMVVTDLTERHEREVELERYRHHLEELVQHRTSDLQEVNLELETELELRESAEEALRASEERFRSLADAMPQLVWTANSGGVRDHYNARQIEYSITATASSGGYDWLAGIHPDDLAQTLKVWNEAVARGAVYQKEHRLRMADGSYRWHLSRGIPVRDESGVIVRWYGTATDIEDLKQAEAALIESERAAMQGEQLRSLAVSLQDAREDERARVARDLHDDIGQILTAIKMELNWIERRLVEPSDEMMERVKSAIDLTGKTVNTVRRVCSELRPSILDDLGLAAAIEWQTREFSSRTGIPCEISVPAKGLRLDPATATAVFRIYQECLTNAMRHAQARSVSVSLYERDGNAFLRVEDDGKGFLEAEVPGSLGLLGMKERARGCGGELEIESSPGMGTTVTLKVPK